MKIYTKTGDKGTTSLIGGKRVSKADERLEAYGTADELNSYVGWLRSMQLPHDMEQMLHVVQNNLFVLGGALATDRGDARRDGTVITEEMVSEVERNIDTLSEGLPEMRAFILPGGSQAVSLCHVCRTVTRRLERRMVALSQNVEVDECSMRYVNRLSDFFFVMARRIAFESGTDVFLWRL